MTELDILLWILLVFIFIIFLAGMEVAFVNANRLNIELKKKQGKSGAIYISQFMEKPTLFIATCFVGICIFIVIYGLLFSELMKVSLWNPFHIKNPTIKLLFEALVSSFILIIVGEFLPKSIFKARGDNLLIFFAPVVNVIYRILAPISLVFITFSKWILKNFFNIRIKENEEPNSKLDVEYFFPLPRDKDNENQDMNAELFENALSLPTIKIRQCLVPRTEIEAVDINSSIDFVKNKFIDTQLSRIIVYEKNIDNIQGYIHQLDLFKKPLSLRSILLPISVVPQSMSATDLIAKFTQERITIAWVVDEFGGTAGIVTLEDVLEEIFGDIRDEYDTEEYMEKQINSHEFVFSGRLELDYLNEKYGFDFPENESETLSGYIINEFESIPKMKERIIIRHYEFEILNVSGTRIDTVKMQVLE